MVKVACFCGRLFEVAWVAPGAAPVCPGCGRKVPGVVRDA